MGAGSASLKATLEDGASREERSATGLGFVRELNKTHPSQLRIQ